MVRFVWTASCGNKATINKKRSHSLPFLAFAVLQHVQKALFKNRTFPKQAKTRGCRDSTWLGSINESYKHKPNAASVSPAACTQRTHSCQSGHHEETGWRGGGGDRHFNLKEFFSHSGYRGGVEGTGKHNLCWSTFQSTCGDQIKLTEF